jgi:hypothetical protein
VELSSQLNFPAEFDQVDTPEASLVQLELGDQHPVSHWVYALVTPYPTITDQVSLRDIKQSWKGNPSGPFVGQPLLMDERTYGVFSAWWGESVPQAAKIISTDKLLKGGSSRSNPLNQVGKYWPSTVNPH